MATKTNNASKILSLGAFVTFIFFAIATGDSKSSSSVENSSEQNSSETVEIGEVLKTQYFDIIVNEARVEDRVSTGNEFADLDKEEGNKYLIINVTFKNTDTESRMIMEGSIWINHNGKNYKFDKSETIMLEGWGIMLDQLNPLTAKTTNIVYKVPKDINGVPYWQPGRSNKNQRILLSPIIYN